MFKKLFLLHWYPICFCNPHIYVTIINKQTSLMNIYIYIYIYYFYLNPDKINNTFIVNDTYVDGNVVIITESSHMSLPTCNVDCHKRGTSRCTISGGTSECLCKTGYNGELCQHSGSIIIYLYI